VPQEEIMTLGWELAGTVSSDKVLKTIFFT
jgi:hypothetical protein